MRLTCPKCGAQYEVPDEVIPTEGRDVQCSACGTTWFHAHPDHPSVAQADAPAAEIAAAAEDTDDEPGADNDPLETPPRRELDPEVAEILRSEADRESRLRAAERDPTATAPALDQTPAEDGSTKPAVSTPTPDGGETTTTPHGEAPTTAEPSDASEKAPRKSGFLRGFSLIILLAMALVLIYSNAAEISAAMPALAPTLDSYVDLVNQGRVWLDATISPQSPQPAPTE